MTSPVYYNELYFQDGIIAQSANHVASNKNVPYFSLAGNSNTQSWQGGPFVPVTTAGVLDPNGCPLHDFSSDGSGDCFRAFSLD